MPTGNDGQTRDRRNARDVYLHVGPMLTEKGVSAFGQLTDSKAIVVLEGARAAFDETESTPTWTQELRRRLIVESIWVPVGKVCYRQVRDYEYASVSSASNALMGSMTNGHQAWRFLSSREPIG